MGDAKSAALRIEELSALIEKYNEAYYLRDKPLVSDADWDAKFRELQALEEKFPELRRPDSPTQRVGAAPQDKFKKIKHRVGMLSLANAMSHEEIDAFDQRVLKLLAQEGVASAEYYTELKFDGLSINLIYENGFLVHAVTRGDGAEGEDVTPNVRTIKNVPLRLKTKTPPALVEIRGEIILPYDAFQELNEEQTEAGEEPFANPRNAAAGSVRQLDSRLTAGRNLKLFGYGMGAIEGYREIETQSEIIKNLVEWGFTDPPEHAVCSGIDKVHKFYDRVEGLRESLPFDIDGVVIKLNSLDLQKRLGNVARSPRSMVAAKFPPRQEKTKLIDIIIQVGRTGVLSPVAVLKPVVVHGVTVGRATLHNQEEIERKDVRIGDTVIVQRAGDVIPEVVGPVEADRDGSEQKFSFPKNCPSCGSEAVRLEEEIAFRCVNESCPAQKEAKLEHFVSKAGLDIAGLGPKILEQLTQEKLVSRYSDLYTLKAEQLLGLEGFKQKSAEKLVQAIEASKESELSSFIAALGIRHIGSQLALTLAREFRSITALLAVTEEKLSGIDAVGPVVAKAILDFFGDARNREEVERLQSLGLDPKWKDSGLKQTLAGKTLVVTGTLPTLDRTQVEKLIVDHGGKAAGSVSKKTSYIIAGEAAGSKLDKGRELGIPILNEAEFLKLIGR